MSKPGFHPWYCHAIRGHILPLDFDAKAKKPGPERLQQAESLTPTKAIFTGCRTPYSLATRVGGSEENSDPDVDDCQTFHSTRRPTAGGACDNRCAWLCVISWHAHRLRFAMRAFPAPICRHCTAVRKRSSSSADPRDGSRRYLAGWKRPRLRNQKTVLVLSSGAMNGAFPAVCLKGWSERVGTSAHSTSSGHHTGALIAPFAFLGSRIDATSKGLTRH